MFVTCLVAGVLKYKRWVFIYNAKKIKYICIYIWKNESKEKEEQIVRNKVEK